MGGTVRGEIKTGNIETEMSTDDAKQKLNTILFAEDTVLIAESEWDLQNQ